MPGCRARPDPHDDLARIQTNQQHLPGLIDQVLHFARLESGAVRHDLVDVGIGELLDGLEALVLPPARAPVPRSC